jgi:hypothetical protein
LLYALVGGTSTVQHTPRGRRRPSFLPTSKVDGGAGASLSQDSPASPFTIGKVDGGAAWDGGVDRVAAKDGGREQLGMGRGCGAAALEKATVDGCAACGEQPCATLLEKTSGSFFFFWSPQGFFEVHKLSYYAVD